MRENECLFRAEVDEGEHREESVRIVIQQSDLDGAAVRSEVEQADLKRIAFARTVERADLDPVFQPPVQDPEIKACPVADTGIIGDPADLDALNGRPQKPSDLAAVQQPFVRAVAIPCDQLKSVVLSFAGTEKAEIDPVELFFIIDAFDGNAGQAL